MYEHAADFWTEVILNICLYIKIYNTIIVQRKQGEFADDYTETF